MLNGTVLAALISTLPVLSIEVPAVPIVVVVFPTIKFPDESILALSKLPVSNDTVSAAGKRMAVFVSPL